MVQFLKPVLILVVLASSLFAKNKETTWLPRQFKASFVSIDEDIFNDTVKKTKGEISYSFPKRLKLEYFSIPKVVYINNLSEIYLYRAPEKDKKLKKVPGELKITNGGRSDLMNFFDSLRVNGLTSNKNYKVKKENKTAHIVFSKEKAKQLKMIKAKLTFSVNKKYDFKSLSGLEVTLDTEKVLNYELDKIDTNVKLSKEYFVFDIPKNTNVERN